MRVRFGIRLHWEEYEWRKVLSWNQMELEERGLVSGGWDGMEKCDKESEKFFIFNFLKKFL